MVMAFHVPLLPTLPAEHWLTRASNAGQTGVDLFFVLSGFLITRILLASKGSGRYLRTFYFRRVLRIFPLYYFVLLLTLVFSKHMTWVSQLFYWTYFQDFAITFGPDIGGPGHFWSLAVEEHFYLAWPFLVRKWDSSVLRRVLTAIILLTIAARVAVQVCGYPSYYFTLSRLDGLALGALIAVGERDQMLHRFAGISRIAVLSGIGPWLWLYLFAPDPASDLVKIVRITLTSFVFAGAMVILLLGKPESRAARLLQWGPLRSVGKYSYAMYVFHPMICGRLAPLIPVNSFVVRLAVASVAVYLAAMLSWKVLENPFLRLKDRMPYSAPLLADAPPSGAAAD